MSKVKLISRTDHVKKTGWMKPVNEKGPRKVICKYWNICMRKPSQPCRHAEEHEPSRECKIKCKIHPLARCTMAALAMY